MIGPLLVALLLSARPAPPFESKGFQKELQNQRRLHAQLKVLPWTSNALRKLLPAQCNGRTREQALWAPLELHDGSGVRLAYRAPEGGVVEVTLADLAGVPPSAMDGHFQRMRADAEQWSQKGQKVTTFRPVEKSAGFWHAGQEGQASHGQVLVGGRFLVQVSHPTPPSDAGGATPPLAPPEVMLACFKGADFKTLLAETKPRKRR